MSSSHETPTRDERVNQIIAEYLHALDTGQAPDRQEFLARHPELASELAAFFADRDQFEHLARPLDAAGFRPQGPAAADMPTLAPGETAQPPLGVVRYFGDYELLAEIARGGMGVVYKARQVSLNRLVALKMILAGQLASDADKQRFYAEARTAANLQHPNIVAIHEVGEHKGQHYFSMDLVEGKSLSALTREHPLPPNQAAALVQTVAQAIHYAHQQGVLHRDLKPANVLIDRVGQ